jgi:hypothetical protein
MEFSKIASETIETVICYIAYGNTEKLPEDCVIKGDKTSNRWVITSLEEKEQDKIDRGQYAQPYDSSTERYFTVLNGFVLAFIDTTNSHLIDLESVEIFVND